MLPMDMIVTVVKIYKKKGRFIKMYRILGKKGRTTIPFEMRKSLGLKHGDVISFTEQDDKSIVIRRENGMSAYGKCLTSNQTEKTVIDIFDKLTKRQQNALLLKLLCQAERK